MYVYIIFKKVPTKGRKLVRSPIIHAYSYGESGGIGNKALSLKIDENFLATSLIKSLRR